MNSLSPWLALPFYSLLAFAALSSAQGLAAPAITMNCDVIVAGGSTAASSAALTSAREGSLTCLLEPTDWAGGQMTAGGVPAIDFAWHSEGSVNVGSIAKQRENLPSEFVKWMDALGNTGDCSVSKNCYKPKTFLDTLLIPALAAEKNLKIFYGTVVKRVSTVPSADGKKRISEVAAIRRKPVGNTSLANSYNVRFSDDVPDWYAEGDSDRFTKQVINFKSVNPKGPIVVDATEFGDVLALSGASYLQGVETIDGGLEAASETCGQSFVFPFVMKKNATNVPAGAPNVVAPHPEFYAFGKPEFDWNYLWRYRRLVGSGTGAKTGELSMQNWNPGNDYAYGYFFKSRADAAAETADWKGGLNYDAIRDGENHSYGFFNWLRDRTPGGASKTISLDKTLMGTQHGFSKFPYLRDVRRSIGLGNFVLKIADFKGGPAGLTGKPFADRVATGSYNADIHKMEGCDYPAYIFEETVELPFYLPLRAMTNRDVTNLLVAGKTMAQSFYANSATRLQPIEYSSGIGAGAAASHMARLGLDDTAAAFEGIANIQAAVQKYAPLHWTINGVKYPRPTDPIEPILGLGKIFCPPGATPDFTLGFCTDKDNAYGPFTRAMKEKCESELGGPACTRLIEFTIDGRKVLTQRWEKAFAISIRGSGRCSIGSAPDAKHTSYCVEEANQSESGKKEVYGPFPQSVLNKCVTEGGGEGCFTNRWEYLFFDSLLD